MKNQSGFTLLELLVTISIVGILAATGISKYAAYKERAKISAAFEELRVLRGAFYAYITDEEELPSDVGIGEVPDGMENLVPSGIFSRETPIGGSYNWDGPPNHDPPGISIEGPNVEEEVLVKLDSRIDDGDLNTGSFQKTHDGHYKLVVNW